MASQWVSEVSEANFSAAVLERSRSVPVVVDFWAPWCGPCRALTPVLVREIEARGGKVVLAKINTDENQSLAAQYRISGIPAVKVFRDGVVVDEFTGALPAAEVSKFLDKFAPSGLALLVQEAEAALARGDLATAQEQFANVLAASPRHEGARLGLVKLALAQQNLPVAREASRDLPSGTPARAQAEALLLQAEFRAEVGETPEAEWAARVESNPADLGARWALAASCWLRGAHEEALAGLIEIVRRQRSYREDGARKALLALFQALGDAHPLTVRYRRTLSSVLF